MPTDKPSLDLQSIGTTGLPVWGGRVYDENLRDLAGDRGRRIFREMSEQDPIIGGILMAVEMLARQVSWSIKPADDTAKAQEVAEFIDGALTDMSPTFGSTLSEILSMLTYGWSWLEILYKRREGLNMEDNVKSSLFDDGKVGWGGWQIRSQETLDAWEFNGEKNPNAYRAAIGPLTAMWQSDPQDTARHRIPRFKSLHFVTRSRRENPEGISLLRNAYRAWYMKKNIEIIEGIGIERDLAGLPVLWAPPELFSATATPEQLTLFARLQKIVTSIKRDEQEGILMPMAYDDEGKNPLFKLELLSTGGDRQFDTNGVITRYNEMIAMSMLADFMMLGQKGGGSFALASSKTTLFSTAMTAILDVITEEINDQAFPKLTVLNGWPLKKTPTLQHGKIEAADMSKIADYLNQLNAAGMTIFPNQTLEKFLIESAGLPGSSEITGAGDFPLFDPETGEQIVQAINPLTGLPTQPPATGPDGQPAASANPGTSPDNIKDVGARPQAPRSVAIRREVKREEKGVKRQAQAASDEYRAKHFTPLPIRLSKLAVKLTEQMTEEDYTGLLLQAAERGKFSKLDEEYQAAVLKAEGKATSVQG